MNKIGQINRGSVFGEKIYNISRQEDVRTIVEIGTWNGMGSTKCIYDAVIGTNKLVYSLECNRITHEEAKINLGFIPPNFKLIHGTIVDVEELKPMMKELDDVIEEEKKNILKGWLKQDIDWIRITPNVINKLPKKIDFLIIDGGLWSGYLEFMKLWSRCHYIGLDDTKSDKHIKTRKFILENPEKFKMIYDDEGLDSSRNGFLICEVKK